MAFGIGELGMEGGGVYDHRGRWRNLSGPWRAERWIEGGVHQTLRGIPGDEAGPLGRPATSLEARGDHSVGTEQVLHRAQRSSGPCIGVAHPTPEFGMAGDRVVGTRSTAQCINPSTDRRLAQIPEFATPAGGYFVTDDPVSSEPAEHWRLGKSGQITEGADAQPIEQLGQVGATEDPHRKGGQEVRSSTGRDDQIAMGGEDRGEQPIGHPDLDGGDDRDGVDHLVDQRAFAAEVASRPAGRERADPCSHRGNPRTEDLHHADHLDERAQRASILVLVEKVGTAHDEEAVHAHVVVRRRPSMGATTVRGGAR